jgi:hypothetical protein
MTGTTGRRGTRRGYVAVLVLAAGAAGCGAVSASRPSYPAANLQGAVTLDGQPIAKGTLQFLPPDGSSAPVVQAEIKDGRYSVTAVPLGKVRVMIYAVRETGRMDSKSTSEPIPEVVNLVPERYRDGIEINVKGDNTGQNFELKSK